MKKIIGSYRKCDFVTMFGTTCSFIGIILTMNGYYLYAIMCLIFSGICDACDGLVARKSNSSEWAMVYGVQLDSLSDCIAFGVFPAYITITIANNMLGYIVGVIYMLCGIIRLSYFNMLNITGKAKKGIFIGVPITTVVLLYPLAFLVLYFVNFSLLKIVLPIVLLILAISFILNVEVKKIDFSKMFKNQ